jgi:site-specific DNA recombinase
MSARKKAVGYCRVSSEEQAEKGWSIDDQAFRIRERIEQEDWELVAMLGDPGWRGDREDRPDFQRMLSMLGDVDVIVVAAMDRLTRDLLVWAKLMKAVQAAGVDIEPLTGSIDLDTPEGEAMAGIQAIFGQLERKKIGQRVRDTMRARARAGLPNGGPRPYGYDWQDYRRDDGEIRKRLVINEAEATVVRRLFEEYAAGTTQVAIARALNDEGITASRGGEWHQGTIATYLGNELYAGLIRSGRDLYEGQHEAVVSRELWEKTQQLRSARQRTPGGGRGRPAKGHHVFTNGLLRCGCCGGAMLAKWRRSRTPGNPPIETYECATRVRRGPERCPQIPMKREPIDAAVWRFFEHVVLDVDATRAAVTEAHQAKAAQARALAAQAEREAQRAEARYSRVRRDYQDGKLAADDWTEQRDELIAERDAARAEVERHRQQEADIAANLAAIDTEQAVMEELAALRAIVLGDVQDDTQTLASMRATLTRTFERFVLEWHPLVANSPEELDTFEFHHTLTFSHEPRIFLRPVIRPEALAGGRDDGEDFPALRRAALSLKNMDSPSPSPTPSCAPG